MFFRNKEVLRIDKYTILTPIQEVVGKLHIQLNKLAEDARLKPPHSIDARKYELLKSIVQNIDETINIFNKDNKPRTREQEIQDIGTLAVDIAVTLAQIEEEDYKTLAAHRNNKRANTNTYIHYGFVGTGMAVGTTLGGPALGAGFACATGIFSYALRNVTGLSNNHTRSTRRILELVQATDTILTKISYYFGHKKTNFTVEFIDEGKPKASAMQADFIYVYLNNGSIFYALKNEQGRVHEVNLDPFLDKNSLLSKNRVTKDFEYKYGDLNTFFFEDYLNDVTKANTLEISLNSLSQAQIALIYGAIQKSMFIPCNEHTTVHSMLI